MAHYLLKRKLLTSASDTVISLMDSYTHMSPHQLYKPMNVDVNRLRRAKR